MGEAIANGILMGILVMLYWILAAILKVRDEIKQQGDKEK